MKKYLFLNIFMLCATLSFSQGDVTMGMRIAALRYPEVGMPQENLMPVVVSGKIGFVNHDGELALPPTYDKERDIESYRFRDGLMIVKKNGKYGYLNTKLEEV
ncbi:MAG: WG repeat-containing protein, partial [Paludibacteraceae bacterium]|nr:WG repeat-containing protein [Paludibacteraceae bacterium]